MTPTLRAQVMHEWRPFAPRGDWPPARAVASMDRLVPGVMKGLGLEQRLQQSRVFYLWPTIVGADIARHAQPVTLHKGVLGITVDHPIWLQELKRYHQDLLLQKIQKAIGPQAVRALSFRIG